MVMSGTNSFVNTNQYLAVIRRRWLLMLAVMGVSLGTAFGLALREAKIYAAEEKILVRSDRSPSLTGLDQNGLDALGNLKALGRLSDPIATVVESMRSPSLLNRAAEFLQSNTADIDRVPPSELFDGLEIKPVPGTDIISIRYAHTSPEFAVDVVRTVTDLYIESDIQANQAQTSKARQFIQGSLPDVERELRQAEQDLRQFREINRAASLDNESEELIKLLARLEEKLVDNQSQLTIAAEQVNGLRGKLGVPSEQAVTSVKLSQTAGVQKLLEKLETLESQLDSQRTIYQDSHPSILALNRDIASVKARLGERVSDVVGSETLPQISRSQLQMGELQQQFTADLVRSELERNSLMQEQEQLQSVLGAYRQRLDLLPRLEQQQEMLTQRLNASRNTYEMLLKRLQEIQLAENQSVGNITKIAAATPPMEPVASDKKLILAAGILFGSLMSVSLAFLVDWLDRSIKSAGDAQQIAGYPILGAIPQTGHLVAHLASSNVLRDGTASNNVEEAYRSLQTNLHYALREDIRTLLITSVQAGERQTETAINLAATIASHQQSVLLIDLDTQSPEIDPQHQQLWRRTGTPGLVQILSDQAELSETLQRPAPHLYVLTLGMALEQRPILALEKLSAFLKQAKRHYQFVILSAPALRQSAEALALSRAVDGMLLVVNPKISNSDDLAACAKNLQQRQANVLGMVLNDCPTMPLNQAVSVERPSSTVVEREFVSQR